MRARDCLGQAIGATVLVGVTVMVDDPARLVDAYERLFGPANVHTTDDIVTVRVGPHRILFAEAEDFLAMYPEIDIDEQATAPFIAVLTLRVIDPEATVDYLTNWQIPYEALPDRRVLVPAEEANGAVLEFIAAPQR